MESKIKQILHKLGYWYNVEACFNDAPTIDDIIREVFKPKEPKEQPLLSETILPKHERIEMEKEVPIFRSSYATVLLMQYHKALEAAELQVKDLIEQNAVLTTQRDGYKQQRDDNWNSLQASEERVRQAVKFIKEHRATTPGMGALIAILTEYQEIKDPEKEKLEERVKELEGTLNHANKVIADKIKESIELHSSLDHDKNRIKELESEVEKLKGLIEEAWEAGYDYGAGYLSATTFDQWKEAKGIK
jgi:DNA repair exonuclease SbcCD ATPase subunit